MTVSIKRRRKLANVDVCTLRRKAIKLLKLCNAEYKELSILLTNDEEMKNLNHTFRNRNSTTDVLSFSQQEDSHPSPPSELLGDVVISIPTALRQAETNSHSPTQEIIHLLIHGVLHLLGFDHEKVGRARTLAMQHEEKRLLSLLGFDQTRK